MIRNKKSHKVNYLVGSDPGTGQQIARPDNTAIEISGQPELWLETWNILSKEKDSIKNFVAKACQHQDLTILLTGAGTSAFIGESLIGPFQECTGRTTKAVPTTDLVSHPELYFQKESPTLMVSFARSGSSPESTAAVDLGNSLCENIYHLIITCNPSGELAVSNNDDNRFLFLLPPHANDKGLAMTGSYTSMLLAGLLIARIDQLEDFKSKVQVLSGYGENILINHTAELRNIANLDFRRAVFLGSGPLLGTAQESHLKLQELTDGNVICQYDSFLGFRHGPKAVIDKHTLMVYLFSNSNYVQQYEIDLLKEINGGERGLHSIGICEIDHPAYQVDFKIKMSTGEEKIDEELLPVCSVLPAQILGYFKSLQLGLCPDQPSVNGAISRVVTGVEIYPYHGT